jgi:hypothetical protein
MKVFYLFTLVLLMSCGSTEGTKYNLVIPKSTSNTFKTSMDTLTDGSFKILYVKDQNGNNITKTLNRSTTIQGNETETLKQLHERAKKDIVQFTTEEVNGVVIRSSSKIDTTVVEVSSGDQTTRYSRQDFTEDAVAQTAGIAQVKNLQCETLPVKGKRLEVKCSADVTVPLIKEIYMNNL